MQKFFAQSVKRYLGVVARVCTRTKLCLLFAFKWSSSVWPASRKKQLPAIVLASNRMAMFQMRCKLVHMRKWVMRYLINLSGDSHRVSKHIVQADKGIETSIFYLEIASLSESDKIWTCSCLDVLFSPSERHYIYFKVDVHKVDGHFLSSSNLQTFSVATFDGTFHKQKIWDKIWIGA